ncbi:MAG: hypothetical protein KDC85_12445 [Saprospiraceae bacterium]|nr:hypothetical protein [Saprospiraceae bacterium]MCB9324913.1 hypothetical protein [Lewinellaceae bacterium]
MVKLFLFVLPLAFFISSCGAINGSQKKSESVYFEIINHNKQSFEDLNREYDYYGKEDLREQIDTSLNFILIRVNNNSDDTTYVFLTKFRYISTHYFYAVNNGNREYLGYKGGADWGQQFYSLEPNKSEIFLESYQNPPEISADEIDFVFEFSLEKPLVNKKTLTKKITLKLD